MCSLFGASSHTDCQAIADRDKRGFDQLTPILIDVDNDGRPDKILPRVYVRKANAKGRSQRGSTQKEAHWIAFDLKTTRGRSLKQFFSYQYGSDRADYWVYAIVPCDMNNDGKTDLIFYSGDDQSDDTIVLLNVGGRFLVQPKKHTKMEY
jgi:hypothetical protein